MESFTRAELVAQRDGVWAVCGEVFEAYEKCRMEKGSDPELCLRESTAVVGCSQKVMREIVKNCQKELNESVKCIEENNMRTIPCEEENKAFNECFDKLVAPKFL
ncbi:hypothetical protein DDB_G0284799 [Dictyostelium discoideum AX4]|uniref:NADH dehydrogenase [ubiquinone] 1 alpha subcomplex subunit 8 n=1 Tax=Dictyostelium discoideum TaxID=44689 RepID=NDUA8_DICDI|nr:hypothetical protein DDB_G0284799 [Dictyostelium discoideum AX4]Q54P46.1 RecName: Full=NADH dehydrogenase [ubiquinone] 1 alpha subcomplex subunit 8 [Dictyostelium discoideum]EAL65052.1 hypothetical protein DDB_G0284799 [Dictyostelium discoideum AX4]|eukprot:XP_638412.1 hypothetical protein DDB_G0284799 [Dictyostelium discoideum AX4]